MEARRAIRHKEGSDMERTSVDPYAGTSKKQRLGFYFDRLCGVSHRRAGASYQTVAAEVGLIWSKR